MPELAEVAYASSLWKKGLRQRVVQVLTNEKSRVYRERNQADFRNELYRKTFSKLATHGKQMLFGFSQGRWLGVHLGMTGSLSVEASDYQISKHDALLLRQNKQTLVFRDPRQFGRLRLEVIKTEPDWWKNLPPSMTDVRFDPNFLAHTLKKHAKRPLKALLLDQRYFQGMGNWMADEVLWRAKLHPAHLAGKVNRSQAKRLFDEIIFVVRGALDSVGTHGGDPPRGWLFHARWKDGGLCPKTQKPLSREQVGGRTSCWCPFIQRLPSTQRGESNSKA